MQLPVSDADIERVQHRHKSTFIDCQGFTVRSWCFKVFKYIGDAEVPLEYGKVWAWCISDARKILGNQLRDKKEWRGCDGRIIGH